MNEETKKEIEVLRKERDDMIGRLKKRLEDPYIDSDTRVEILTFFKDTLSFDWLKSSKTMKEWRLTLRRLANVKER